MRLFAGFHSRSSSLFELAGENRGVVTRCRRPIQLVVDRFVNHAFEEGTATAVRSGRRPGVVHERATEEHDQRAFFEDFERARTAFDRFVLTSKLSEAAVIKPTGHKSQL
jgi:hypothetical protein